MIWFTSDTHFGHSNILKLAGRPFADAAAMENALVANINALVAPTDTLYHLGDFSMKLDLDEQARVMKRIRCRNLHILPGNHDKRLDELAAMGLCVLEPPIVEFGLDKRRYQLCHYPIADWNGKGSGAYHLHGHIHSHGMEYNEACRERGLRRYDVGMDANGYCPVSLEQICAFFEGSWLAYRMKWTGWIEPLHDEADSEELRR